MHLQLKGFVTKRDMRHFWKAEIKGKNCWFFLFTYIILQPLITFSVYIFNLSNKATVVGGRGLLKFTVSTYKMKIFKNGYVSFCHETLQLQFQFPIEFILHLLNFWTSLQQWLNPWQWEPLQITLMHSSTCLNSSNITYIHNRLPNFCHSLKTLLNGRNLKKKVKL